VSIFFSHNSLKDYVAFAPTTILGAKAPTTNLGAKAPTTSFIRLSAHQFGEPQVALL
jgi:hypothetical protein